MGKHDLTTRGYFYFCDEGTPHVNFQHIFGAKDWYESNYHVSPPLGEDSDTKSIWYRGDQPALLPFNHLVGKESEIANGADSGNQASEGEYQDGFPETCFVPAQEDQTDWDRVASFNTCCLQYFYATIIEWMYDEDPLPIEDVFALLLGDPAVVNWHPGTGTLPAVVTVIHPDFSVLIVAGTTNFQQLALQAFTAIVPPQDFGGLSTTAIWYAASDWALNFLIADGANPTKPLMVSGHSYGAVTAILVAARARMVSPGRQIRYLTYGLPKPGDSRIHALIASTQGIAINGIDDPVTALPPTVLGWWSIAALFPGSLLFNWDFWYQVPNPSALSPDGKQRPHVTPTPDTATLANWTALALANLPIPTFISHKITEYRDRIAAVCHCECWPLTPEICKILKGVEPGAIVGHEAPANVGLLAGPNPAAANVGLLVGSTSAISVLPNVGAIVGHRAAPGGGMVAGVESTLPLFFIGLGAHQYIAPVGAYDIVETPVPGTIYLFISCIGLGAAGVTVQFNGGPIETPIGDTGNFGQSGLFGRILSFMFVSDGSTIVVNLRSGAEFVGNYGIFSTNANQVDRSRAEVGFLTPMIADSGFAIRHVPELAVVQTLQDQGGPIPAPPLGWTGPLTTAFITDSLGFTWMVSYWAQDQPTAMMVFASWNTFYPPPYAWATNMDTIFQ